MKPLVQFSPIILVFVFFLDGCAAFAPMNEFYGTPNDLTDNDKSVKESSQLPKAPVASASFPGEKGDLERLARLWELRSRGKSTADYPVGPGDVVEISVPAIEELRGRVVRISGDGTISLPYIGRFQAAGLTEEELREKLAEQLRLYMYSPRVVVFVKEYRSRQVAVLGAVVKPGLYSLSSGGDTLLDMISQAGGIAPGADPKIYLIPAEPAESDRAREVTATLPESFLRQDPAPLILKRTDPILIDIKQIAFGGNQQYMSLSIWPGDVIMVPGGGQVLVEGWVEKPGAYNVSPGLTVAGVVAASGGPLYPADVNVVKVLRADKLGAKSILVADLEKIKRGESSDIALQTGDIVEVPSKSSKLIPWGLYRFFTAIVSVGVSGSLPVK
jgi:polysaccharide export outer membrane protein